MPLQFSRQIELIPTDYAVLDQSVAALGDLLFGLFWGIPDHSDFQVSKILLPIWDLYAVSPKITLAKTEEERKRLLDIIETHSPQSWGSFNMLGEFDFSDEKLQDTTGVLPLKKQAKIIPENWGPPNR